MSRHSIRPVFTRSSVLRLSLGRTFLVASMYICGYTYSMPTGRDLPSNIQKHFQDELLALWPVLKGSLAEVRKPCIRQNCQACARGDKHAAFIWSYSEKSRRRCMYV